MARDSVLRKRWLLLVCALALGVIAAALVLYGCRSAETSDAVEAAYLHNVERLHPGSAIEVESLERESSTAFTLEGSATMTDGEAHEFSCYVYSDMHGGWQIAMNGEVPTQ